MILASHPLPKNDIIAESTRRPRLVLAPPELADSAFSVVFFCDFGAGVLDLSFKIARKWLEVQTVGAAL